MLRKCLAECIGTAVLVTFGCGVAATNGFGTGMVGIALAFGLVIVAMAYSIGNVSGCHVNPAVSIAMLIRRKMTGVEFVGYVVSQFIGAIIGALVLWLIFSNTGYASNLGFGTNGYLEASTSGISILGAYVAEIVLTFVFVIAVCGVTSKESFSNIAGVVIGLALTLVHLFGLPLTGTSVNPARSFGPALVSMFTGNSVPMEQVHAFIIAPLIGGILAALVYKALAAEKKETLA